MLVIWQRRERSQAHAFRDVIVSSCACRPQLPQAKDALRGTVKEPRQLDAEVLDPGLEVLTVVGTKLESALSRDTIGRL